MARRPPAVAVVVAGRNDDYGGDFRARLLRTAAHNVELLGAAGFTWEYLLVEWNPLPDRPLLSAEFTERVPGSRALVVPAAAHDAYSMHPGMPFHEMPAKNAGIRRSAAPWVIVTNADILFHPEVLDRLRAGTLDPRTLYRARRVDVPPALTWTGMQDPARHLASGEGELPPVDYLGAGGDFCLASRDLWHELRGFDERVRFSTRAKDWQFFLSARTRGIPIEFVGTVFHLDHEGGFRNTSPALRRTAGAHFGGPWDVEFGLPTSNPDDWGLGTLAAVPDPAGGAIDCLQGVPRFGAREQLESGDLQDALAGEEPDWLSAGWLHVLFQAWRQRRRVHVEMESARAAARLTPWLPLALDAGIDITGTLELHAFAGFATSVLAAPTAAQAGAAAPWVVTEEGGLLIVSEQGRPPAIFPERRPPHEPAFNPMLARRLLLAWIELARLAPKRVLLYGAGSHTRELLGFGWPDTIDLSGIIVSEGADATVNGLAVGGLASVEPASTDAIVVSSVSYEPDMTARALEAGFRTVVPLYGTWPRRRKPLDASGAGAPIEKAS